MQDITAPDTIRVTFFGTEYEATAHFSTYASNAQLIAIQLIINDSGFDEPLATATVNLEELGFIPAPHSIFVKDYAETEGLAPQLVSAGVAKYIRTVQFGGYDSEAQELELMGAWRAAADQALQLRAEQIRQRGF